MMYFKYLLSKKMTKLVVNIFWISIIPCFSWGTPNIDESYPNPSLNASDVVSLQLLAMQQNDESNKGIEITFRFASPQNKLQTGPLENFIMLVRNISYRSLLNHVNANFLNLKVEGDRAMQEVVITTANGSRKGFRFLLSLQKGKQFKDCWMTDAVIPFGIQET